MEEENIGTSNIQVGMVSYFLKLALLIVPFRELHIKRLTQHSL
jgi:hypothetical protein